MRHKKNKPNIRYIPLDDIKAINKDFLDEMENVKKRLGIVRDADIIKAFQQVLLSGYNAEIEIRTLEREVDYDIRLAEIEARRAEIKPWRRCWLWRLLFQPLTNRAQDIIEERVKLNADIDHTAAEKAIDEDRKKFFPETEKPKSKRKLRREMKAKLKAALKKADNTEISGAAFDEPQDVPPVQEQIEAATQEQLRLDVAPKEWQRAPRPPKSCRKPK